MLSAFVILFIVPCVALLYFINSIQLFFRSLFLIAHPTPASGDNDTLNFKQDIQQSSLAFHTILSAILFL